MEKIKVSIICNAFNHEKYIKDALESFLMQKTNFAYEVLVHDDASTDKTADIIREYEKAYPNIIKPIYQIENQYSKGVDITDVYNLHRVNGKYIALCEGDDYWTDPLKLQKQFDALESNLGIDMCSHAAIKVKAATKKIIGAIAPANERTVFSINEVIIGGGGFVATNSLFFRRGILEKQPEFCRCYPLDYSLQINGALRGGMLYLPDIMSAYRIMVPNSWTYRINNNYIYKKQQVNKITTMLSMLNKETKSIYFDTIEEAKFNVKFSGNIDSNSLKEIKDKRNKKIYNKKSMLWKVKFYIKYYFPNIAQIYRKIKQH